MEKFSGSSYFSVFFSLSMQGWAVGVVMTMSKMGNRLWTEPVPRGKPFLLGFDVHRLCIYIKAWPEVGWYWSSKEELGSRGEVAEAGKRRGRILRVPGCDDLLSQLLAHNRVSSLKRFQRQSYVSWCVCMQYHANRLETGIPEVQFLLYICT